MIHESLKLSQRRGEDLELSIVPDNREQLKFESRPTVQSQYPVQNHCKVAEGTIPNQLTEKDKVTVAGGTIPNQLTEKVAEGTFPNQLTEKDKVTVAGGTIPNQLTEKGKVTVAEGTGPKLLTEKVAEGIPVILNWYTDNDNLTDSTGKPKPTTSALGVRKKSTAGLFCMVLLFFNAKPSLASKADEIKIDNQIVMEGEEFCFKYRQIISNANCYVKLGNEAMSSDELQDGRNLTLVSGENWCTMCIINFKLESIFRHLAAESNYIRTIDEVFGVILMEKLSVYAPNDLEGSLIITTVGRNIKCLIQLLGMRYSTNDTSVKENNNITLVKSNIKYMKSESCLYNIICHTTEGMTNTVTHETENCSSVPTMSTELTTYTASTPTVTTQLPDNSKMTTDNDKNSSTQPSLPGSKSGSSNLVAILTPIGSVVVFVIVSCVCIKKRDAIKKQCTSRMRHESVELQQGKEEIELQVPEPETDNGTISKTLVLVNQPMLPDRPSCLDDIYD